MGEYWLCPLFLRPAHASLKLNAESLAWWAGLTGPRYLGTGWGWSGWSGVFCFLKAEDFLEEREEVVGVRGEVVEAEAEAEADGEEVEEVRLKAFRIFSRKGIVVVGVRGG